MPVEPSRPPSPEDRHQPDTPSGTAQSATTADSTDLRCQWCSVPLAPGVTLCPTCGSPGVPDPRFDKPEPAPVASEPDFLTETPVVGLWREETSLLAEEPVAPKRALISTQEAAHRQAQTLKTIVIAVVVCVSLGWLAGPLLAGSFESFTGTPVENTGDLRPLGAFLGLLGGLLIGGIGGTVIWSGR